MSQNAKTSWQKIKISKNLSTFILLQWKVALKCLIKSVLILIHLFSAVSIIFEISGKIFVSSRRFRSGLSENDPFKFLKFTSLPKYRKRKSNFLLNFCEIRKIIVGGSKTFYLLQLDLT